MCFVIALSRLPSGVLTPGTEPPLAKERHATERTIDTEVPVGSNESRVVSFLRSRGIEHSHLCSNPDRESDFHHNAKLDGKRHRIAQYFVAFIRDVDRDPLGLISWSLAMHFYFDADGALVAYTAERIGTGPWFHFLGMAARQTAAAEPMLATLAIRAAERRRWTDER
jgi:hypothetical protein